MVSFSLESGYALDVMQKQTKTKRFLLSGLKGIALGIAAAIPGLSAGSIAVILHCYQILVDAMASFRKAFKKSFLTLLPYFLGLILGAVAALVGIKKGYEVAPFTLTGFFAGCVFGSLPVACSELRKGKDGKEKLAHILSGVLCFAVAAALGIVTALTEVNFSDAMGNRAWWMYPMMLLAGFVAAFTCVVPGISGSMSLMVLGVYYPILHTFIGQSGISIWAPGVGGGYIATGIVYALLLVVGALFGLWAASHLMKNLLAKHRATTFYGILGLLLGSLVSMFINSSIYPQYWGVWDESTSSWAIKPIATWDYVVGAVLFVLAAGFTFWWVRKTNQKAKTEEQAELQQEDSEKTEGD